jgi:hypothetical protein
MNLVSSLRAVLDARLKLVIDVSALNGVSGADCVNTRLQHNAGRRHALNMGIAPVDDENSC